MYVPFIERMRRRAAEPRVEEPHCVRCGRGFVASGLDESSRCWWCARLVTRPTVREVLTEE